jgi:hypothetical protein
LRLAAHQFGKQRRIAIEHFLRDGAGINANLPHISPET